MLSNTENSRRVAHEYHISKGKNQLGPCSLHDLRTLLAYGSVRSTDMVRRGNDGAWQALETLEELREFFTDAELAESVTRRRTVRYREYEKTPEDSRESVVLKRLIVGFLLFPPLLWRAAVTVYQSRVITPRRNEGGYLEYWPRWTEGVVSALIVVNALLWWALLSWVGHEAQPLVSQLASMLSSSFEMVQAWLGHDTPGSP